MNLTAVLFVGGESKRMGRDKAMVEVHGEFLWSRQLRLLRGLNPDQIVLSCAQKPVWCPDEVVAISDNVLAQGPLGGLTTVLAQVKTSHLLALAIDLPRMNQAVLHELWTRVKPGSGVVPTIDDSFEPLCAVYPKEAAHVARETFDSGERSMQRVIRRLVQANLVSSWPVPPELVPAFLNANSPDDLTQL
jgi:Molybdopterin-guanine dinucleotide biosynthesis protein A